MSGRFQALQVVRPVFFHVRAEFVQRVPGIDAGIMAVVEMQADGVVTDLLDLVDIHVFLADLENLFPRPVSLHFRGG